MGELAKLAAPYLIGAALVLGGVAYLYEKGRTDERNGNASKILVESEQSRKLREGNDANARSFDDDRALGCLRKPDSCR